MRRFLPLLILIGISQLSTAQALDTDVRLWLSSSLTAKQKSLMREDLRFLSRLDLKDDEDANMRRIFQIPQNTNLTRGVEAWLSKRVKYVVAQNFKFGPATVKPSAEQVVYPKAQLFPSFFKDLAGDFSKNQEEQDTPSDPPNFLMENVGAQAYGVGKVLRRKMTFLLEPGLLVPVLSPRVGVVRVGPRFFATLASAQGNLEDPLYRIRRLQTLVHEGRHGDGEGRNLSFPHYLCPPESDYAGQYACDIAANGGYRTGALFLKAAIESCRNCSEKELEIMRVLLADNLSRVVNLLLELPVGPEVLEK